MPHLTKRNTSQDSWDSHGERLKNWEPTKATNDRITLRTLDVYNFGHSAKDSMSQKCLFEVHVRHFFMEPQTMNGTSSFKGSSFRFHVESWGCNSRGDFQSHRFSLNSSTACSMQSNACMLHVQYSQCSRVYYANIQHIVQRPLHRLPTSIHVTLHLTLKQLDNPMQVGNQTTSAHSPVTDLPDLLLQIKSNTRYFFDTTWNNIHSQEALALGACGQQERAHGGRHAETHGADILVAVGRKLPRQVWNIQSGLTSEDTSSDS